MEEEKGRVCVTGGTGFIGSWLIMRLLDHGYSVRTTVRSDPEQKRDLSFLTNLPGASERLQIFNADLNNPESFDAAIAGCTGVIHVAAPIDIHGKEPEEVIIQRAVSGTIGILKSCLKIWNREASCVHFKCINSPFQRTWIGSCDNNTFFRSGPFIVPQLAGSVRGTLAMVMGNREEYSMLLNISMVHIDDVARAHIFLLEYPDAKGEQKRDLSFLTNLPGASERLQIFNADLNNPESFDAAIAGCTGVIHVAAPIDIHGKEPEEVIIQRAVSGTIGILKSCLKSGTVKRVVYTSSASTVHFSGKDVDMLDETFWSDVDYIRKLDIWGKSYKLSKTLTERTALEFAEEHGLDLVTIIPSFVTGPFICPQLAGSVRGTLAMVMGNREEYSMLLNISMVHIDDVARAHIFLLEYPDVKGRYICSSATLTIQEMAEFLSAKYPGYPIPNFEYVQFISALKISIFLIIIIFQYNGEILQLFSED
ncbi:hypothetical protein CUMW_280170 [Citrus unshiu]|uniref:NAD-dependent epimerase/dehydratase domain-containing protein n=1 Tax=Citrus unshiu TaxID=55188 RepID=A0A2H5NAD3_CITUN|nr:hypothetical protein CUMW_280170 [Citrus unshiu]